MNSTELRALIAKGPFSQRSAAYMLGIHERTLRGWLATRDTEIPFYIEYALRWAVEHTDDSWIRQFVRAGGSEPGHQVGRSAPRQVDYPEDSGDPTP